MNCWTPSQNPRTHGKSHHHHHGPVSRKLTFKSCKSMAVSAAIYTEPVTPWTYERALHVCQKCILRHEPIPFYSSWVKNAPTWLHPEEQKLEANKQTHKQKTYFCCMNMDRTTTWNLRMEILAYFLFLGWRASLPGVLFKGMLWTILMNIHEGGTICIFPTFLGQLASLSGVSFKGTLWNFLKNIHQGGNICNSKKIFGPACLFVWSLI